LQSDQIAAGIGVDALKTLILMNAGAVIAVIAFAGQVWGKEGGTKIIQQMIGAGAPFVWGVISGVIAFPAAYFYQSSVTYLTQHMLWRHPVPRPRWAVWLQHVCRVLMVIFGLVSVVAFVCGAVKVRAVFST